MQGDLKTAYDEAINKVNEMVNGLNIIMNAAIRAKLSGNVGAVKEYLGSVEKVASRLLSKAQYEAEMQLRLKTLEKSLGLLTVASKKNILISRYSALAGSINRLNAVLNTVAMPMTNGKRRQMYGRR